MSGDVAIHIENIAQIRAAFQQAPKLMNRALVGAINKSLLTVGSSAVKKSPVRTGLLRGSILDPNRGLQLATPSVFSGSVGSGVGYGGFVEYGTRFMRAQPYLRPAVEDTNGQVNQFFTDAVDSVFNAISRQA